MSLDGAAEKLQEEAVDGRAAIALTSSDLKEAGVYVISERKKTEAALENLRHPLMTVFASVDFNDDFRVDAEEISHVMSNVSGTYVTEATVQAKMTELNLKGNVEFADFKYIMEHASDSEQVDWSQASKQLSLSVRFLAAGDGALSDFHAAMRAGTKVTNKFPEQFPPRCTPGVFYRALSYWIGCIVCFMIDCLTLGLFSWFGLLYLSPRGQCCYQWLFGLQSVDCKTGKPSTLLQLYSPLVLDAVLGGFVAYTFGSTMFWAPAPGVTSGRVAQVSNSKWLQVIIFAYVILSIVSLLSDPEGRSLMDRAAGTVIIFKEPKTKTRESTTIALKNTPESESSPQAQ